MNRDEVAELAAALLEGACKFFDPASGLINLPGQESSWGSDSDGLEGLARTLLIWSFLHAGEASAALKYRGIYLQALKSGPHGGWRKALSSEQALVEASSVALALSISDLTLWNDLSSDEKAMLVDWFRQVLNIVPSQNNWIFFPLNIKFFLNRIGEISDEEYEMESSAVEDRLESWQRGTGIWTDGDGQTFDYYGAWSFNFYPPLLAYLRNDQAGLLQKSANLSAYCEQLLNLIDIYGRPTVVGRSLTYRFAVASPLALSALIGNSDAESSAYGQIWRSVLNRFKIEGVFEKELLLPGWMRDGEVLVQRYSGPASPYWAGKAFVALLLPKDHSFWGEPKTPIQLNGTLVLGAGLILSKNAGVSILFNHGSDHQKTSDFPRFEDDPNYALLGYSSVTFPKLRLASNGMRFSLGNGFYSTRRGIVRPLSKGVGWAMSFHYPVKIKFLFRSRVFGRKIFSSRIKRMSPVQGSLVKEATFVHKSIAIHTFFVENLSMRTATFRGWETTKGRRKRNVLESESAHELGSENNLIESGLKSLFGFNHTRATFWKTSSSKNEISGKLIQGYNFFAVATWLNYGHVPVQNVMQELANSISTRQFDMCIEFRIGDETIEVNFQTNLISRVRAKS
jgi:hypothetical protein